MYTHMPTNRSMHTHACIFAPFPHAHRHTDLHTHRHTYTQANMQTYRKTTHAYINGTLRRSTYVHTHIQPRMHKHMRLRIYKHGCIHRSMQRDKHAHMQKHMCICRMHFCLLVIIHSCAHIRLHKTMQTDNRQLTSANGQKRHTTTNRQQMTHDRHQTTHK